MTRTTKLSILIVCLAAAFGGCGSRVETTVEQPNVEPKGSTAIEFDALIDPSSGKIEIVKTYGTSAKGLNPATVVQDGAPGSGPMSTVELVTTSVATDPGGGGACGPAGSFCGDVVVRSFYAGPLTDVYVELTAVVPAAGHASLNSDPAVPGVSAMFGLWLYGPVAQNGGSATRQWIFQDDGTAFRIRGRVMANFCSTGIQDADETGVDCGGIDCAPCGMAPTCMDGIQNQGETGIDCGGPCPACAPTCMDGIQNQGETGVDCGGPCPACAPTCTDGIQNGGETGIDCGGPCPFGCNLVINEVEYDEPGVDNGEFIEIFNPTAAAQSLANLAMVLINGANNLEYGRTTLSGTLASGAYAVICPQGAAPGTCAAAVGAVPGGTTIFNFAVTSNAIQNGAPDGVILVNLGNNTAVDALSYEGAITAGVVTGAGTFNLVEGTPATAADDGTFTDSMQRTPNGQDTNDAATDWARALPTPGAPSP